MVNETHEFTLTRDGKAYACKRVVTDSPRGPHTPPDRRVYLQQTIYVQGVGEKDDPAEYGPNMSPVVSMESIARLIAGEILRETRRQT